MLPFVFFAIVHALRAGYAAFDHLMLHAVSWMTDSDTFRFGACVLCSTVRNRAASDRRMAATGRYYRTN